MLVDALGDFVQSLLVSLSTRLPVIEFDMSFLSVIGDFNSFVGGYVDLGFFSSVLGVVLLCESAMLVWKFGEWLFAHIPFI